VIERQRERTLEKKKKHAKFLSTRGRNVLEYAGKTGY